MIKLLYPLRDIQITQPFGTSFTWYDPDKKKYVDFYKNLGLNGHQGIDFMAKNGCPVLATHNGEVHKAYFHNGAGNYVEIIDETYKFATGYCHLEKIDVKVGDKIYAGEEIGTADNTGVYTTGSHLHFEFKLLGEYWKTDKTNGYNGCSDPAQYFKNQYGNNWDKPAAYHRYWRKQDWLAEFNMRFKNVWLHKKLGKSLNKIYDTCFINKLVYGAWSFDEAINPAMNFITDYLTKSQMQRGFKPFQ